MPVAASQHPLLLIWHRFDCADATHLRDAQRRSAIITGTRTRVTASSDPASCAERSRSRCADADISRPW